MYVKCEEAQIKILSKFLECFIGRAEICAHGASLNYIGYRDNSNVLITI